MKKKVISILVMMLLFLSIPAFVFAEESDSATTNDTVTDSESAVTESGQETTTGQTKKTVVKKGWVKKNGKKYYYVNGKKVTGWKKIKGDRYYFNKSGIMQTGMTVISGKVYYLKGGVKTVREGWKRYKGNKYYGYSNGTFANKPVKIKNKVYMFYKNGKLVTKKGLFKYKGKYYYGMGNGKLKTGWVAEGKKAMYFNEKNSKKTGTLGSMARNTKVGYLKIPKNGKLGYAYALGVKQLDKMGWSLENAYVFSYRLSYGGRWYRRATSEEYSIRGFTQGWGNCYVMAATFYVMAKLLGYDVHQVEGRVDLPHSWTVIKQNGVEWVYDPNFRNETGRNGWKIYYGKRGTWRYNSFHKMN